MDDIQETQLDGAQKTRPKNPSHYKLESVGDQSSLPDDEELQMVEQRDTQQLENEILNGNDDILRNGREIFFQGFNWESHKQQSWWNRLKDKVSELSAWGFTSMWLPPAFDSLAPQGYLPRDLYSLNTAYGSEGELRNLLQAMHRRNLRAMADVVINHRIGSCQGIGGRYNRYDGMPMPWDEHAVTCDTGGLGNPSTGAIFEGVPNIDHTQEFVRNDLKNWMNWLRNNLGFSDFRFDFAKGYSARFVMEYIQASWPKLSIGEYWDDCSYVGPDYALDYNQDSHRQRTVNWIDGCGGLSCAFDFTTKAILQEAVRKREWWRLRDAQGRPPGVLGMWPSRAVTFVDNHDTGSTQGYAYILTHPGQPCVFYDHVYEWGEGLRDAILNMISIRKWQGVHSRSKVEILEANSSVYAAMIDNKVCMKLGEGDWCPCWDDWQLATSGQSYAIWQKPKQLLTA
ncbi:hypothetical protein BDL97_17G019100 [Sphagnum fallax]|nr:hypothetical protein BDL97_17G019100 [Sphagnum fallax]KAH8935241.1 hypothetical protein BDL97_17G019100 [Sphagnum fallax]